MIGHIPARILPGRASPATDQMIPTTTQLHMSPGTPHAGRNRPGVTADAASKAFWQVAARLWWASLIVIHLPILATVVRGAMDSGLTADRLGSLIALAVTVALFAAKLADAPMLRLRSRRQSIVAMCLATAIMHHEAFAAPRQEWVAAPIAIALTATVIAGASGRVRRRMVRITRVLLRALSALVRTWSPAFIHACCGRNRVVPVAAFLHASVLRLVSPRGPPHREAASELRFC